LTLARYTLIRGVDREALPGLVKLLEDKDKYVCRNAAWVLGVYAERGITDREALPGLVKLLEDEDPITRWKAVSALDRYARQGVVDGESVSSLVNLLRDEYEVVRSAARRALSAVAERFGVSRKTLVRAPSIVERFREGVG